MTDISSQQEAQIRELIGQRRMIDAIKLYREATGVGLKEAKDAITEMWHGRPVHPPPMQPGLGNDALLEEQIKQLLAQRQKIQAVNIYREAHNCGLKDAKDAVDGIEAQLRRQASASLSSVPGISNDPFADDTQRNRRFLAFLIAIVLVVIGGIAILFLSGGGF